MIKNYGRKFFNDLVHEYFEQNNLDISHLKKKNETKDPAFQGVNKEPLNTYKATKPKKVYINRFSFVDVASKINYSTFREMWIARSSFMDRQSHLSWVSCLIFIL